MRNLFFFLFVGVMIASCGDDAPAVEEVKLESYEDRLSYVLGAMNAKSISDSDDPDAARLDKALLLEGFELGLGEDNADDCIPTLQSLFGQNGQDFNEAYIKDGSKCLGRITAVNFYTEMKSLNQTGKLNNEKLLVGFKHGLEKMDTLIAEADQMTLVNEFFEGIAAVQSERTQEAEKPFWEAVKAKNNVKEMENGVYLEVLKEGKGPSPAALDDVEAHYTLTTVEGDTMESSKAAGKPLQINLTYGMGSGIIQGWTIGFQGMKKGGRYNLYVPSDLAYGKGSLCFEVDLLNFGPQGSMVQLQQPQMPAGY